MRPLLVLISLLTVLPLGAQHPLRHYLQSPGVTYGAPYGANPAAGHYVRSGDARIYYEVYGEGPPLAVLHGGIFGSTLEMGRFIDSLSHHFRVIAISTRGHGKSEPGTAPLSLEQRAQDAMAAINAVTAESVTLLGFSDGGYTAYSLAARYPNRVKRAIVMGAGVLHPGLVDFTRLNIGQALASDTAYWAQQRALAPEPDRIPSIIGEITRYYSSVTVGREVLGRIECPVLVLAGDRDPSNRTEDVVAAARLIKQASLGIVPNTGHALFLENFPAVWAVTAPFLGLPLLHSAP